MIGVLKLNLEKPEDRAAHMSAVKADQAYGALYDITQILRGYRKHGGYEKHFDSLTEDQKELLAKFIDMFEDEILVTIREQDIDLISEYR